MIIKMSKLKKEILVHILLALILLAIPTTNSQSCKLPGMQCNKFKLFYETSY